MTQCADILQMAFFEAGLTTELQHATPTQTTNAMTTLSDIISFLYGSNVGEYLQPWPLGNFGRSAQSQVTPPVQVLSRPPINSQLVATNEEALTVYLPVDPSDGARMGLMDPFARLAAFPVTVDGNGRTIGAAAQQVINTTATNRIWFYRGDIGNWVLVTPLLITDEMPFPADYDQMFKIMMAMRLNPVYGRNISSVQSQFLKEFRRQFIARYVQSSPLQINGDLAYATRQSYNQFADAWPAGANTDIWDRGGWGA